MIKHLPETGQKKFSIVEFLARDDLDPRLRLILTQINEGVSPDKVDYTSLADVDLGLVVGDDTFLKDKVVN